MESFKNVPWYFVMILFILGITYLASSIRSKEGSTYDTIKSIGVAILALLFVAIYLVALIY